MRLTDQQLQSVITARDALNHNFCVRGQRRLWNSNEAITNNVTFEEFVKKGVTVSWLLETGNPYAVALVEKVLGVNLHG